MCYIYNSKKCQVTKKFKLCGVWKFKEKNVYLVVWAWSYEGKPQQTVFTIYEYISFDLNIQRSLFGHLKEIIQDDSFYFINDMYFSRGHESSLIE